MSSKNRFFVDSSAYIAFGNKEYWTMCLDVPDEIYTPESVFNEISTIVSKNKSGEARVKLSAGEIRGIEHLLNKTSIVSDNNIDLVIRDAIERADLRNGNMLRGDKIGRVDSQLIQSVKDFKVENPNLSPILISADQSIVYATENLDNLKIGVVQPFSKSIFEGTIDGVRPHFVLEDALEEYSKLSKSGVDKVWGNIYFKEHLKSGYVYSFTDKPVKETKTDRSYFVNFDLLGVESVSRIVDMYKSGGVFSADLEENRLGLSILRKKPSSMEMMMIRKGVNQRNPSLFNNTVRKINASFVNGFNSNVYTVTHDQLKNVANHLFVDSLYQRRKDSLK